MEIYNSFAYVYDQMMDNIPYDEWTSYLISLLSLNGIKPGDNVVELGCGTGTVTNILADSGLNMTGIDLSEDMLKIAASKSSMSGNSDIIYLHGDMTRLSLAKKMDAAVSICDSMNYLLKDEQMYAAMKSVFDNTSDDAPFIFDLKTDHFFRTKLGDRSYREEMDDFTYIWRNHYDKKRKLHKYGVKLYYKDATKDPDYEIHYQRAYDLDKISELAIRAGYTGVQFFEAFTMKPPRKRSDRVYCILRKC